MIRNGIPLLSPPPVENMGGRMSFAFRQRTSEKVQDSHKAAALEDLLLVNIIKSLGTPVQVTNKAGALLHHPICIP